MRKEAEALWSHVLVTSEGFIPDYRAEFGGRAEANHQQRVISIILLVVERYLSSSLQPENDKVASWLQWRKDFLGDTQARLAVCCAFIDDSMLITLGDSCFELASKLLCSTLDEAGQERSEKKHAAEGDSGSEMIALGLLLRCDSSTDFVPVMGCTEDKAERYVEFFGALQKREFVSDEDLDRAIGICVFLCRCVYPRAWALIAPLRAMRRASTRMEQPLKRNNPRNREALRVFISLLERSPLVPIIGQAVWLMPPPNHFNSDAGGRSGGAFLLGRYFILPFSVEVAAWLHINILEMFIVLLALKAFATELRDALPHRGVVIGCDNAQVCRCLNSLRPGRDVAMAYLLNELNVESTTERLDLRATHVPTDVNDADCATDKKGGEEELCRRIRARGLTPERIPVPQEAYGWLEELLDRVRFPLQPDQVTPGVAPLTFDGLRQAGLEAERATEGATKTGKKRKSRGGSRFRR